MVSMLLKAQTPTNFTQPIRNLQTLLITIIKLENFPQFNENGEVI